MRARKWYNFGNFQGEKHLGYHALYQNMKNGHEAVQELGQFVKERASLEEEHGKLLVKNLSRVSSLSHYFQRVA